MPSDANLISPLDGYEVQSGVNPGFEPRPWVPRRELTGDDRKDGAQPHTGVGKYCPRHLHFFTDAERDPAHYPLAQKGPDGQPNRFCWCCGRPLTAEGLSAKAHKGYGKPCPACGFRRARKTTERQMAALHQNLEPYRDLARAGITQKRVKRKVPKVSEIMTERAHAEAESILRPYFEALELRPRESWSPSTTLEFYIQQISASEKLLDRVEGKPVNRNRHVDAADDDVFRGDELSASTVAQLVAALATGADVDALLGEAVDAEWSEAGEPPEEAAA